MAFVRACFPQVQNRSGKFGKTNMEYAISIVEAAKRAGVGRSSIYQAIGRGELQIRKNGRRSLILVEDLKAWVAAMPLATPSKQAA